MSAKNHIAVARECAQKVLEEFGVKSAPVPIERIIKKKSIVLQYAPFEDDLSGMAYIDEGLSFIGINALHHPNRQRFSAAHELGHHLLHRPMLSGAVHVSKGMRVLRRDGLAAQGIDREEIQANAFAAELLMPTSLLTKAIDEEGIDVDDDEQVDALARKFRVSSNAMRLRLGLLVGEPQS